MSTSDATRDPPGHAVMRVMGGPRRSLFDAVRPGVVQQAGEKLRGPGGMALAALQQGGVTQESAGRDDAVVLAGRAFGRLREGWVAVEDEGRALGVAYGLAVTRQRLTVPGRTWCLLRATALGDGRTLEVLNLLGSLPLVGLLPVVVGPAEQIGRTTALLVACDVRVWPADNADAWSVLSAMDHARRAAQTGVAAVVATREESSW